MNSFVTFPVIFVSLVLSLSVAAREEEKQQEAETEKPRLGQNVGASSIGIAEDAPADADADELKVDLPEPQVTRSDSQGRRSISISHLAESGIVVQVTERFGPGEFPRLIKKYPELGDYVQLFPDRVGSSRIELNLNINTVYRAHSLKELKKKSDEAYSLYQRYYRPQQADRNQ